MEPDVVDTWAGRGTGPHSSRTNGLQRYIFDKKIFYCSLQWRIQDFPEEGALTPKGGRQPIIWQIFPENCMKMKKFWARGGAQGTRAPP